MEDSSKNRDSLQASTRAGGSQREEDEEDASRKDQERLSDGELSDESNGEASNDTGGAESFEQLKERLIIRLRELGKAGVRPLDPAALGFDPGPSRKGPFQPYKSIRVGWNMEKVWNDHLSALKAQQDEQARAHAEEEEASHQDGTAIQEADSDKGGAEQEVEMPIDDPNDTRLDMEATTKTFNNSSSDHTELDSQVQSKGEH